MNNYSTDGFNERMNYIQNSNDANKPTSDFDNSFAKMKSEERKNMVETTNNDQAIVQEEVRGDKDKFLLRNNAMNNANRAVDENNPFRQAMNKHMFNQFKK